MRYKRHYFTENTDIIKVDLLQRRIDTWGLQFGFQLLKCKHVHQSL